MIPMPGMEEVLVGIDGSAHGRAAIAWAVAEARSRNCGVLLVHVRQAAPNLWATTRSVRRGLRDLAQPIVDHALAYAVSLDPDVPARGRLLLGKPHRALVSISATTVMTVVGRRDKGTIAANLVGSLSQSLMARSHNPVVAVAPDADPAALPVGRVVVALGDRPASLVRWNSGSSRRAGMRWNFASCTPGRFRSCHPVTGLPTMPNRPPCGQS